MSDVISFGTLFPLWFNHDATDVKKIKESVFASRYFSKSFPSHHYLSNLYNVDIHMFYNYEQPHCIVKYNMSKQIVFISIPYFEPKNNSNKKIYQYFIYTVSTGL